MSKKSICIINCILSVFVFLCVYGNVCFRAAIEGNGGADFPQRIAVCVYFAIIIILSIICLCSFPYYSNKPLLVSAIFSALLTVIIFITLILSFLIPDLKLRSLDFFDWIIIVFPPIISGLYFYAALKK